MLRIIFAGLPVLISSFIFSAASSELPASIADAPTHYNGQKITAENLHLLGEPLPQETVAHLNVLRPILQALCSSAPQLKDTDAVKSSPLGPNLSTHNTVFELLSYMIKISGFNNRLQSMLITKDVWPGQWGRTRAGNLVVVRDGKHIPLQDILPEYIPTYQTASRLRNALLCEELIKQRDLKLVKLPKTYMYLLDSTQPPHDENCVVLEEIIDASPLERAHLDAHLTEEHVRELFTLVEGVGLWQFIKGSHEPTKPLTSNWRVGDMLRDETGVLYLIDNEQPNNSNPHHFFERDNTEHHGNIKSGIEQLAVMCAHDPKKVALLAQLVQSSEKINAAGFSPRFKREINLVLTQVAENI